MTLPDFRAHFLHAPDGMVIVDSAGQVIEANERFGQLVGAAPPTLTGRAYSGLVVSLGPSISQHSSRLPDGAALICVRQTGRHPSAAALHSADASFHALAESLNVALVITDAGNRIVYANECLANLTGYGAEELIDSDFADLLANEAGRERMRARWRARLAGTAEKYELEHRRKDGSVFTASITASPMFDEGGRVSGSVAVLEDVTERRRNEQELADRERRYRSLFDVTPLPTWVFDVETLRFCAVNPAAVAHYGYSEAEFLNMTLLDIRTPEGAHNFTLFAENADGTPSPSRVEHMKKDGTRIQVDLVARDFLLEGRRARIVVAQDVTDEIKLQERQRSVEEQLRLAQKMEAVGGLAGGVAHDFNNLLSVMLGASESIGRDLPASSPLQEDVKDIRDSAERGAALTRQLLSLGRREVRAPELLELNQVVTNVSRLLFRALGPQVRTDVHRAPGSLYIMADAGQLEQVIVNLAINSRDAMPAGGSLTLTTAVRTLSESEAAVIGIEAGTYAALEVLDDGMGMDEPTRARAFEPFFTTKGPHSGTGLGLSTVYGIARQSGGGVTLDSAPGAGTRVRLYFPLTSQEAKPPTTPHVTGEQVAIGRRGRVLLVEDEPRVRAQARRLLERSGFSVTDAHDGVEGLFQFRAREGAIDVVVSDVMMPTMGGVEMVSLIREHAPTLPVVFVSGYTADDRDLPLGERTLFVPKPYSIEGLCGAIDSLLTRT
ncbi:MAG: PAS domain S-box protein [Gemmatimonadota bacterium]